MTVASVTVSKILATTTLKPKHFLNQKNQEQVSPKNKVTKFVTLVYVYVSISTYISSAGKCW